MFWLRDTAIATGQIWAVAGIIVLAATVVPLAIISKLRDRTMAPREALLICAGTVCTVIGAITFHRGGILLLIAGSSYTSISMLRTVGRTRLK